MPKIIENLETRLIQEAKRQIEESGYSAMTIRSVAAGCGVGVGTVYNYFPSKDDLLATYMLSDWNQCIGAIGQVSEDSDLPQPVLRSIYDQLLAYVSRHQTIFQDKNAITAFYGSFSRYHGLLRSQLAQPLKKFCENPFMPDFIAESLLTWTMAGKSYDEIYSVIEKLL